MKQVRIHWVDSRTVDGWTHLNELKMKLAEITTIGFLVKETGYLLCVATSMYGKKQFNGIIFIPKSCVIWQEDIQE